MISKSQVEKRVKHVPIDNIMGHGSRSLGNHYLEEIRNNCWDLRDKIKKKKR